MRNVVFVEVFAVIEGFKPKLAKSFALSEGSNDAINADEAGQPNSVKTFGIEYGSSVSYSLGNV